MAALRDVDDVVSAAQTMKLFAAKQPPVGPAPLRPVPLPPTALPVIARRRRAVSPPTRRNTPRRACTKSADGAPEAASAPNRCSAPAPRGAAAGARRNGFGTGEIPVHPLDSAANNANDPAGGSHAAFAPSALRFPPRAVLAAAAGPPGAVRPRPGEAPPPARLLALFRATSWAGAAVLRRSATHQPHLASAFAWAGLP